MTAGTASASPAATDRSDFRHVLASGTKLGVAVAIAVIVFLAISRAVPPGVFRELLQLVVVLVAAVGASLLPAHWAVARGTQGIAGAAAIGLWGTVVFMAIDIVLLRPFHAYPWTWDAVGGGSTWWYLPIWWMLGTFVAWLGAIVTARRAARGGDIAIRALASPLVVGAAAAAVVLAIAGAGIVMPVAAGAVFTLILTVFAVVAIARARKG